MARDLSPNPPEIVEEGIKEMKIENGEEDEEALGTIILQNHAEDIPQKSHSESIPKMESQSPVPSPTRREASSASPRGSNSEHEELVGGDITVKMEPGQPPKLARSSTQKITARAAPLFDHLPDATIDARKTFQTITDCVYTPKHLGDTEHAMECDCAEEWDAATKINQACGDDSDCINRLTKMECYGECGCGADCQNQRFQRRQYSNVTVIKTEKKGHGLRTDSDLLPGDFIFEYIGEVINETQFRKRTIQYDEEGIKHFYFMSLSRGEFVDATKKGNLGRFCNHSCNPNCYVDKWVVGDKLRMGIFAERRIKAGEELVFNYNVDRYGADPQPCYCGEPNCTGFIGGKTQTERATKLSNVTIEALGIDDGDGWDTAVAKRPRKKKASEDDEEYVNNVQPRALDEEGVTTVMATLMQCKEKWIAVKLLSRIQKCEEDRVISRVVKMHGYQIMNSALATWKEDFNVVLQILDILHRLPRLTKNKITDSKIERTVEGLLGCEDENVESQAAAILKEWSTLETAYRIPRKKRDPNATTDSQSRFDRREGGREDRDRRSKSSSRSKSRSRSRSFEAPRGPSAPTGPRNAQPQRPFFQGGRPPFRPPRPFSALPQGWFMAQSNGRNYYYSASGQTTWQRPTQPAAQPPPPPKPNTANKALDDIINEITSAKAKTPDKSSASATPRVAIEESKLEKGKAKEQWRNLSEEKQKKIYENTLFPHVKSVVDKYKHKLPKDDLKRFFKEVCKKLVSSDFKNNRVEDPSKISSKQEKNVKKFAKDYFDKAVAKKKDHDLKKAERKEQKARSGSLEEAIGDTQGKAEGDSDAEAKLEGSDDELLKEEPSKTSTPITPLEQIANGEGLKRKRNTDQGDDGVEDECVIETPNKRVRSVTPPAPPPPPPPPADGPEDDQLMEDEFGGSDDGGFLGDSPMKNGSTERVNGISDEASDILKRLAAPPRPPPHDSVSQDADLSISDQMTVNNADSRKDVIGSSDENQNFDSALDRVRPLSEQRVS